MSQKTSEIHKWWLRPVPISPILLWLLVWYPLSNWAKHWFESLGLIVFGSAMIIIALLLTIFSYTIWRRVRVRVPWSILILLIAILIAISMYAPHYVEMYGAWISEHFVSELDIDVVLESQELGLPDGDTHYVRYVKSVYELHEPKSVVEQKLYDRLNTEGGWRTHQGEYAAFPNMVYCYEEGATSPPYYNSIRFDTDDKLVVLLNYPSSSDCLLRDKADWWRYTFLGQKD